MFARIGVALAMAVAACGFVLAGQPTAHAAGCASASPRWGFVCLESVSDISLGFCLKEAPQWHAQAECAPRNDGSGRYDIWIPAPH
ncbi:hypothetical protein [Nocardia wallacei]|uniref:hypothetical protein n=1 Tax=Nocardia wallacei TaxID=480035 RepID=UPI002457BAAF|nr:hypothetical protein [Nocardia wallacei]